MINGLKLVPNSIIQLSFAFILSLTSLSSIAIELDQQRLQSIAEDPKWLALLHYEQQGLFSTVYSEVDDEKFFFSAQGKTDSKAELIATIKAFQLYESGDGSAQCRFPERLHYLQKKLPKLKLLKKIQKNICPAYDKWYSEIKGDQLYLIFPASYMNSPSSMFGHTLLRLDGKQQHTLLSSAINFAAYTDPSDDEITFTVKGLTGGYPGYVSLVSYFEKVNEYNHIESRDIWEYKLDLTAAQIQTFTRHIWELNEIRFDYYFIDENCSYRLLTLLNVINPSWKLSQGFDYRTVPTDTIRVLKNHDLISDVTFRPSRTTELEGQRLQLSEPLRNVARAIADDPENYQYNEVFLNLSDIQKSQVLELSYAYNRYLNTKEKITDPELQQRSLKLLSLRSKQTYNGTAFDKIPTPSVRDEDGHATYRSVLSAGVVDGQGYAEFGMRINYHDWLDSAPGYRNGAQIEMGNTRFRANEDSIKLQHFDVISIRSLGPRNLFSQPVSWQVSGGYERWVSDNKGHTQLRLAGGLAYQFGPGVVYGMATAQLAHGIRYQHNYRLGLGPELGYLIQTPKFNLWASYEYLGTLQDNTRSKKTELAGTYTLGQNRQLRLQFQHQKWNDLSQGDLRLSYVIYH
jgi:hypothetical protein